MAYIGPEPNPGQNREVDDISSSFNGSTTAFTLQVNSQNVSPGSSNNIIVSLGGVVQNPGTDYNIAASTITFTTAPANGLSFFGLVLGQQVDIQSLADGTSPTMSAPSITGDLSIADKIVHTGDTNTAIRFPAADTVSVETAGSERLRVDSSGAVGIGTTTPSNSFSNADDLVVGDGSGNRGMTILAGTSGISGIEFSDGTGSDATKTAGGIRYYHSSDYMRFNTGGGTERMRLDTSGRLLVGRTSNITSNSVATCHVLEQITDFNWTFGLHCNQTNKVGMTVYYTDTTNNLDCFRFMVASSTKFVINGSGDVSNANNSYGSVSDVALKENIVDAKSQWNDLKNIKVRNFNFKESTGNHGKTMIGVVAQEVETVSPKLVHTNDDGYKEVSYSVLYMKAIKALQEAMEKIEVLETKVAALEAA
jgi:hypothetical protein